MTNLKGKRFTVQVADGDAEYEVVDQREFESQFYGVPDLEMVQVQWVRNEFDYIGIFGESAWVEASVIAPRVEASKPSVERLTQAGLTRPQAVALYSWIVGVTDGVGPEKIDFDALLILLGQAR